ncbi:MAG: HDOD domain-containing protein [Vicinamibacterales bacterium]
MIGAAAPLPVAVKRILFVDDEPNVLHGLQRMLRPMRAQWQMDFVTGGLEALVFVEHHHVDVVVTDMRMPGMDGVALLQRLVEQHPRIVRIVLSGHAERESLMRGAAVAHQYLSKPCEPDVLRTKLTQACGLSALLADARLNEVASRLKTLPALAHAYDEALSELDSGGASVAGVAAVIERDLGMAANVLQLANATCAGESGRIATCREAIDRLGLDTIRGLIRSMDVFGRIAPDGSRGYDVEGLAHHSCLVGRCAQVIAQDQGATPHAAAEAATAGLLHDVGKLVLADALGAEYTEALRDGFGDGRAVWEIEADAFGASHADVGAYLLGLWGFSEQIIAATAWHHRPSEIGTRGLLTLTAVHAADAIAHRLEQRVNREPSAAVPDGAYLAAIGRADAMPRWLELCTGHENRDA